MVGRRYRAMSCITKERTEPVTALAGNTDRLARRVVNRPRRWQDLPAVVLLASAVTLVAMIMFGKAPLG